MGGLPTPFYTAPTTAVPGVAKAPGGGALPRDGTGKVVAGWALQRAGVDHRPAIPARTAW